MTAARYLDDDFLVIIREAYPVRHLDGNTYVVVWAELYNDYFPYEDGVDPILCVLNLDGSTVEDYRLGDAVKKVAMDWRVKQIRQEMDFAGEITDRDAINAVLKRVWDGEWMGQFNDGRVIYFQELAAILGIDMGRMRELAQELAAARLADILPSSWILGPPEADTVQDGTEEYAGHKKFVSSSWGWWSCSECGKSGDDYSDPTDYPCE